MQMRRLLPILAAGLSLIAPAAVAQDLSGLLQGLSGTLAEPGTDTAPLSGRVIQLIGVMTALSLAPGMLVVMTSFTRFVIVFSMLRMALGLQQSPPNMVITALAFFMTLFVMQPVFQTAWDDGLAPMIEGTLDEETAFPRIIAPFHKFMAANTREKDIDLFLSINATRSGEERPQVTISDETPWSVLVPAFMISELRRAFTIGFLIFLPFIAIDLVVSSVLMGAGMMMLPPVMISLPFKVIFFVLIDGWYMLAGSLMQSYAGS